MREAYGAHFLTNKRMVKLVSLCEASLLDKLQELLKQCAEKDECLIHLRAGKLVKEVDSLSAKDVFDMQEISETLLNTDRPRTVSSTVHIYSAERLR
jgi:hypothetical protein